MKRMQMRLKFKPLRNNKYITCDYIILYFVYGSVPYPIHIVCRIDIRIVLLYWYMYRIIRYSYCVENYRIAVSCIVSNTVFVFVSMIPCNIACEWEHTRKELFKRRRSFCQSIFRSQLWSSYSTKKKLRINMRWFK